MTSYTAALPTACPAHSADAHQPRVCSPRVCGIARSRARLTAVSFACAAMAELEHSFVYVRHLRDLCYYVGATRDPNARSAEHDGGEKCPSWVERHGLLDGQTLRVVEKVAPDDAIGLENIWTARLMWAFGINKVRGGDKVAREDYQITVTCKDVTSDYTRKDISHLTSFLVHHLKRRSYCEVRERLADELPVVNDDDLSWCSKCKTQPTQRGHLCPFCYYEAAECTKCGHRGHVAKWCGKLVHPRLSVGNTPPKTDGPQDIPDALLIQAVDDAEATFRKRKLSTSSVCAECQTQMHGGGFICGECFRANNKCFQCQETGHVYKECPKRPKA